jgi:hypothetical protein
MRPAYVRGARAGIDPAAARSRGAEQGPGGEQDPGAEQDPRAEQGPRAGRLPCPILLLVAGVLMVIGIAVAALTAAVPTHRGAQPGPGAERTAARAAGDPAGAAGNAAGVTGQGGTAEGGPSSALAWREAARSLLRARAAAVVSGRADAWVAGLDPVEPSFRTSQLVIFERIRLLPLRLFRYDVVGAEAAPEEPVQEGARGVVHAQLRYRLTADSRDVVREQFLTIVRRGGQWLLAGIDDRRSEPALWDLGPLTVRQAGRCLLVAVGWPPDGDPQLARTAGEAGAAAAEVDRVWGTTGPRSVVVVVPASRALMAAALGRPDGEGLDQVAAVTSGELDRDQNPAASAGTSDPGSGNGSVRGGVADRVVLNPEPFFRLTAVGRQVVLTHELTHVATRATARLTAPLWAEEGFASYVAYRDTGLAPGLVVADVLPLVREGRAPGHLPSAADFDPAHGPIAVAYAGAWLAFALMSDGHPDRPVAFYRAVAGLASGSATPAQALQFAFRQVLGTTEARFEAEWRAYRQRVAGR